MKKIYFFIAFLSLVVFSSFDSKASHIMGGEITWECLSNGDYKFEFKVYRDCQGANIAPEQSGVVRIHNYPSIGQVTTIPRSQWSVVRNGDLSPDCPSVPGNFSCANGSPESVFEYVRSFTRRLVGVPPSAGWIITYSDFARNSNDNIIGTPGVSLRAKIFRHTGTVSDTCIDNSPKFRELATSLICVGRPFTYNPNATDNELDSLVYDWARPLNQNSGNNVFIEGVQPPNVNFQTGYSFNSPFPGPSQNPNNVSAVLDRSTGEISLTSFTLGKYVSVVKVTAYKCGERVAEIYRELQTNLANSSSCTNNDEPIITPPFRDASNNFTIWNDTVRAGDLVTFNIQAQDFASLFQSGGDSLTLTATGLQFGTNFTSTTGCNNPPCATLTSTLPQKGFLGINNTFSWQTDCNHVSFTDQCVSGQNTYTFVINVEDDVCPLPANNIATISITVLADSVLLSPLINCLNVLPNGDVVLDWNPTPNIQNSFSAWMIYSSLDESGPFTLVDSVKTYSQSTYTHVGAGADLQRRWYHIRSRSGCKGIVQNVAREAVSTIFVDPQVAPTQLNVNWNELDNPNPIGSAAQYRVFKEYPVGTGLNFLQNTATTTLAETFPICEDTVVYRVELVNTIESCTSSSNIAGIRFKFPDPQTNFSFTPANPCPGIPISFTNLTTIPGGTISYVWDFGDASATSTQTNPSHTYAAAGSYIVTLTASSGIGCDSIYTETINVTFPNADAGPDVSICPSGNVSIGGSPTTGLGNTVAWSPSAGLSSTTVHNPVASPVATTTYTVTVTDANGCTNTDQVVVSVNPIPTADAGSNQSVCSGTPVQIGGSPTGPVGASFQWDNAGTLDDATLPNPTATPLVTTTYRVTVTSGVNCSATDQVTITVNPSPNADAGANQSICSGSSISIGGSPTSSTPGVTYSWSNAASLNNASITNPTASPTTTTTYTVTVTSANSCTSTDQVTVTVNSLPVADAGSNQTICSGLNTTIGGSPTGPAGATFSWNNAASLNSSSVANPIANPTATTTYTVTITDVNGCSATDQVTITVSPTPTADAGSNQTICSGASVNIGGLPTGPAGATYAWSNAASLNNPTIANPVASPTVTTTYTVTVSLGGTCTATDQVNVVVNAGPNANAGADRSICIGSSTQLGGSSSGVSPLTFSWNNAGTLNNANAQFPNATPLVTTTYTLTVTDGNGCTSTDQVTVTINPLPSADAGSNQTICRGANVTIGGSPTGPAGATYAWSNGASLSSTSVSNPSASPTVTTTYTVTVTSGINCTATDQVTVTVDPLPIANAGPDKSLCSGTTTTIGSPNNPNYTYQWNNTGTIVGSSTISNPTVSTTINRIYTVTVTETSTGCTNTDQVNVFVNAVPNANAGADRSICIGSSTQLGGSSSGVSPLSFSWNNAGTLNNANAQFPNATPLVTTIYTLTVTDGNGCTSTDQVTVTINPLPSADAGSNQTICRGANVTIGGSPTGPAGATYAWSNGASLSSTSVSNPSASPTVTTTYTVTVTSGINCTATDQVTVTVDPLPIADAGPDKILCSGTTTTIGSANNPNYTYQWNNTGTIVGSSTISNPTVTTTVTRIYTVTVTETSTGCTNTDQVNVFVGSVPNANAGADRSICLGSTTQLGGSSSGVSPLTFSWNNAGTLNNSNAQFPNATPLVTTTYSLTVTDGNGCTSTDQVTVNVNPNPAADAGANQTICSGDNVTIGGSPTGPAGSTYTWNNAASLSSSSAANPVATPSITTTYTVTVTDANLCTATDQVTITVNPSPFADAGSDQSICLGDNVTIGGSPTGPAGVTYAWDNGTSLSSSTIANPVASPTTTTTYTVTVTSTNSCTGTDQVTITVNPNPLADAGIDQTICEGSNLIIGGSPTGPAGATYVWDNGGSLSSTSVANPIADPVVTTTYTVTVTSGLNCSSTDQVTITVNPTPNVDAGPDQTICDGVSVTIGGSPTSTTAGVTYAWDNGASLNSTAVANPIATPTTTTTYTVTVTDANTCTSTDQVIVTVNPLPTADAGADRTICEGTNTSLGGSPTGPAGATYLWNNAGSLNNANAANPVASPLTTTTYSVTVTSGNGCTSVDQVLVTVNPSPTADAGADQTICNGSSVNLGGTPTGPAGSSFSWNNAASLSSSTAANPVATPTSTTTYTVTVTDANLCTATDQVTITVNPTPVADAGADQTICNGANVTIGGSPTGPTGATFAWDNGASLSNSTLANPVASPTTTTTYTVTVTSANLCTSSDQVTITVNPLPTADAGIDQTICEGATVTIGGSPTGPTGATYSWDNGGSLSSTSIANPIADPITTTTYSVTVTDGNSCSSIDQVTITVNPAPNVDAGADQTICSGASVTIGGSPTSTTAGVTYAWGNGASLNSTTSANPSASPIVTTTYTVTVTDGNSCTSTDQVTVTVNSLPAVDAGADRTICEGANTTLGGSPTGPAGASYLWNNAGSLNNANAANPVASPITTTTYSVTVTDGNGCSAIDQVLVTVNPAPNVDAGADQTICEGSSTTIGGSPTSTTAGVTYAWNNGASLSSTTIANPSANPIVTTTYTVTVTDANSCTSTDQIVITVNPAPNVDAGADQNLCIGNSVTIGGSPTSTTSGVTYAWNNAASLNNASSANPVASPTVTTTYTVTVTDVNSCTSTDQVTITVNPLPIVDAGADQTICEGSTASIGGTPTGPSGSTFAWDNGASLSSAAIANPIANPVTTTIYTVTVTDLNGCSATDQVTITVNPSPNVNAGADQSICEGASATIGGSPTSTTAGVTYAWDNGASLSSTTVANPLANPIVTTTYTVTVTDGNTCTSTDQVTITVNPAPNVDAGTDQTICEGASVTIGGSPTSTTAGVTFAWDNGASLSSATIANPVANPITTTTYSVTVTDGNSCTSTDQVTITVNPAPIVDAGADQTICEGSSVTIGGSPTSSTAGVTYAWDNGGSLSSTTVANPVANPIVTTTYTITVTDANACTSIDQMTVNVDPAPNVDAGADQSSCIGNSVTIGGSPTSTTAGVTYAWDNAISLNDASAANPVATPLITTTYRVTITDGNACTSTDQVTVTVNPLPIVDAGVDQSICEGLNTTIGGSPTGPAGSTYLWDNAASLDDITLANPVASPLVTTTYSVTVTDVNSCVDTDNLTIFVNPSPVIDAGADQTICLRDSVQIGGSPTAPTGISFSWTPTAGLSDANAANPMASPTDTTKYFVSITDANGCISIDSMLVNVNPLPIVDFQADALCLGDFTAFTDQTTLSVGNISSWDWDFGDGFGSSNLQNPAYQYASSGSYSVTLKVETAIGCFDSVIKTVEVNPLPIADAGNDTTICFGDTVQIGIEGSSLLTYSWSPATNLSDVTVPNPLAFPLATGDYFLSVTDANGCFNFDTVTIFVNQLPNVIAEKDTFSCVGESIQLNVSGAQTYIWSPDTWLDDPTIPNPIANALKNIEYTVRGTDINGCVAEDTITISVFNLDFNPNNLSICIGDTVQFNPVIQGDTTGITYLWTPSMNLSANNVQNPFAFMTVDQQYILQITNQAGCDDLDSLFVEALDSAGVDFEYINSPRCSGSVLQIENTSVSTDNFEWYLNDVLVSTDRNPQFDINYSEQNVLTLVGSNANCTNSITKIIPAESFKDLLRLKDANVFTPNGDGINDFFSPGFEGNFLGCASFQIYDRWGKTVFDTNIGQYKWDGRTLGGYDAPEGVYFYVIKVGSEEIKGSLLLTR